MFFLLLSPQYLTYYVVISLYIYVLCIISGTSDLLKLFLSLLWQSFIHSLLWFFLLISMHFIHLFSILLPVCFNKFSVQCVQCSRKVWWWWTFTMRSLSCVCFSMSTSQLTLSSLSVSVSVSFMTNRRARYQCTKPNQYCNVEKLPGWLCKSISKESHML